MLKAALSRFSMTSILSNKLSFAALYLERLQKYPGRVAVTVVVFGLLWYLTTITAALFWSILLLAWLIDLPAKPFFLAALLVVMLTPVFYFLDRPTQAERVGVLFFALLALGTIVNIRNTWHQPRNRLD